MKRHGPVNVIFYFPKDEAGKEELAGRVAEVHADIVIRRINALNCSAAQKLALLDAVIETAKQRSREADSPELKHSCISRDANEMRR